MERAVNEKRVKEAQGLVSKQDRGRYGAEEVSVMEWASKHPQCRKVMENFREQQKEEAALDDIKWFERPEAAPWDGLVRWTHCRKLDGGAGNMDEDKVQLVACVFVTVPSEVFIQLAMSETYEDDLTQHFTQLRSAIEAADGAGGVDPNLRVCIGLSNMRLAVSQHCRKQPHQQPFGGRAGALGSSRVSAKVATEQLDLAVAYCIYELGLEMVVRGDEKALGEYLVLLTVQLTKCVYAQAPGGQQSMEKHKRPLFESGEDFLRAESEAERRRVWDLRQLWVAALKTIPSMSEARANSLVNHDGFSCPRKLLAAAATARANSDEVHALADQLSLAFGGKNRQHELANRLVVIATREDPDHSI